MGRGTCKHAIKTRRASPRLALPRVDPRQGSAQSTEHTVWCCLVLEEHFVLLKTSIFWSFLHKNVVGKKKKNSPPALGSRVKAKGMEAGYIMEGQGKGREGSTKAGWAGQGYEHSIPRQQLHWGWEPKPYPPVETRETHNARPVSGPGD